MAEFGQITKDRIVTVTPKDGRGSQTFAYATLAEIVEATRPALTKRGLVVIQALAQRGARTMLFTRLAHAPGQWVEGAIAVPQVAHMQQLGSAITYLRRYTYSALLGMAAEDDEDGNAAVGNQATRAQPRKQSAPQPKQLVQSQPDAGDGDEIPDLGERGTAGAVNLTGMAWSVLSRDGSPEAAADRGEWIDVWRFRVGHVASGARQPPEVKRRTLAEMQAANSAVFTDLRDRGDGAAVSDVLKFIRDADAKLRRAEDQFPANRA